MTADDIIALLGLEPHPEGGWFRETWIAEARKGARPAGAAIHFLLRAGEVSHWHRFDADEVWYHHLGGPLILRHAPDSAGPVTTRLLGADLAAGQVAQIHVPAGWWQTARPAGGWALVGCSTAPAFDFAGFELAPPGFDIAG